jgi:hypothetical protein
MPTPTQTTTFTRYFSLEEFLAALETPCTTRGWVRIHFQAHDGPAISEVELSAVTGITIAWTEEC